MNHSNISTGGTAGPSTSSVGYAKVQSAQGAQIAERKPELIRVFDEYACLLERLAYNINQLEERLSMYCGLNQENDSAGPCPPPFTSGAASLLSNNNDTLTGQIRRLEVLLSTLEL